MTAIKIFPSELNGSVSAPPSKSYTHRAVILSCLASGRSRVNNPLISRDTLATIKACQTLGAAIDDKRTYLQIEGKPDLKTPDDVINVENSGTTMRLITAVSSLTPEGYSIITGDESIRSRPMQPLLSALSSLGVNCYSSRKNGLPPIIVEGGGIKGGETTVRGDISSQFISALLISTPKAKSRTLIRIHGKIVSRPYIDATLKTIKSFGGDLTNKSYVEYIVPSGQDYHYTEFDVPGDFSSASLLIASALLAGRRVKIEKLNFSLPQADMRIVDILEKLGADFNMDRSNGTITLSKSRNLKGGEYDLSDSPDLLPVLSVVALNSGSKMIIKGVEHARFKETDRISILAKELRKFGAHVQELRDGMAIEGPKELKGCSLDAHGDHRLFMALFAAAMASSEPCTVEGVESVDVSYPDFIGDMKMLGALIEGI
ncbi:MAG: 3-phosphoshikimate 1-carboxyvinyltransferase [Candidatus Methylarchaceae archaeon HK01B]|nr:3-phosphoshikimate 1-carboxyvinyltransferase [Candidatus Methylarchaceae archaeon HK01M]MCP8312667.1 3-phosphoshikimate 1-carboxyvinyltransferase [Candidatus Methylarchaceae archaeon HK02M1]MCP8319246.1 3-phosphoshikimate 1-carboxyvinyltransferase [Candidatus Methylarchaceae archaeon HK01B]